MKMLQNGILAVIGACGGLGVAAGLFAFISVLGMIPRLAGRLGLARYIYQMETVIALGGITGCVLSIFQIQVPLGMPGVILFGFFSGVFVGALIMALAETLKVLPILCQRANLLMGFPVLVVVLALGKALGSLYQLYFLGNSG
ncbi:MAG: stage V sporulation protein AB [Clostridiaceae bacterium]|nr:stage V sporulation protein AB [Clostridiaceae bacterium]